MINFRYQYQKEHGRKMDNVKITKLLLIEVEKLMEEVSSFVQSCCNSQLIELTLENDVSVIDISERLSQGVLSTKVSKVRVNDVNVIPKIYKESLFEPLQKKEFDFMDVEQTMINTIYDDDDDDDLPSFPEDLPDDFKMEEPFPTLPLSGYPEPTLVPGKEGGKIKTFYKCEKCNKSFPKRKRYYNHKVSISEDIYLFKCLFIFKPIFKKPHVTCFSNLQQLSSE